MNRRCGAKIYIGYQHEMIVVRCGLSSGHRGKHRHRHEVSDAEVGHNGYGLQEADVRETTITTTTWRRA